MFRVVVQALDKPYGSTESKKQARLKMHKGNRENKTQ